MSEELIIFNKFDLCMSSNKETVSFLKKLGLRKARHAQGWRAGVVRGITPMETIGLQ